MALCKAQGGLVSLISSPKWGTITASCQKEGNPFSLSLPSWASPKKDSKNLSIFRAGRNQPMKCASSSPSFQKKWGVPAGMVMDSPPPAISPRRLRGSARTPR